ncbi:MAG: hypothetical protein RL329_2700 [Bacteroidota bacterium]|jgi:uncharacterized protein (TIGR02646 family)
MRYIDKSHRCIVFDKFVKIKVLASLKWKSFGRAKLDGVRVKSALHLHLWSVQKGLCAYCEQEIPAKMESDDDTKSHLEHIRPKADFPDLTYQFENLIISCEGFNLFITDAKKGQFCGHVKDNSYDDAIFLNPTENQGITNYFRFDSEGQIEPNPLKTVSEQNQARYMIETLGLDNPVLNEMRKNQYDIWLENQIEWSNEQLLAELDENQSILPAFYSLLQQKIL